eukprot:PhF_6_TR26403/c1_g2_i2/m.38151
MKTWATVLGPSITALSGEVTMSGKDHWKHKLIQLEQNLWILPEHECRHPVSMLFFNKSETNYTACLRKMGVALNGSQMKENNPRFLQGPLLACYLPFTNIFHAMKE